jgi:hypothetical protein
MESGSSTAAAQAEKASAGASSGEHPPLASQGSGSQPARGTASKYDFVKVRCSAQDSTLIPTPSSTRIHR